MHVGGFPGASRPFEGLQGLCRGLQGPPGASRRLQAPKTSGRKEKNRVLPKPRTLSEAEISCKMVRLDQAKLGHPPCKGRVEGF